MTTKVVKISNLEIVEEEQVAAAGPSSIIIGLSNGNAHSSGASTRLLLPNEDNVKEEEDEMAPPPFSPFLPGLRRNTSIVAYLDMMINVACIAFYTFFLSVVSLQILLVNHPCFYWKSEDDKMYGKTLLGAIWTTLIAAIVFRSMALWASVNLYEASHLAEDKTTAKKLTALWRALAFGGWLICPWTYSVCGIVIFFISLNEYLFWMISTCMLIQMLDLGLRLEMYVNYVSVFIDEFYVIPEIEGCKMCSKCGGGAEENEENEDKQETEKKVENFGGGD